MKISKYQDIVNENKMVGKNISNILKWIEDKSILNFVFLDTETTGLGGPKKQQLTQVSAISVKYDFTLNKFTEISKFDDKIKLTTHTKKTYNNIGDRTKKVLSFNRYGNGDYKYKEEKVVVDNLFDYLGNISPCMLVAQNAAFDMSMLGGRFGYKIPYEVFDTKMLIQLYYLPLLQKLSEKDIKYKEIVDKIGTSDRDNGLISSSMGKIGPSLGINMSGYHDSLTDCRITMEMFTRIINILKQHREVDIKKYQLDRINSKRN